MRKNSTRKYKRYFEEMLQQHKQEFEAFEKLHAQYAKRKIDQKEYNEKGESILRIVKEWETKLCSHMESGQYNAYSARLAEKFWEEVRKKFPLIEFVGVEIVKAE